MNRTLMRVGALAGAATLASVTAAPGYAATVSKASASALTIDVGGQGAQDSGKVTATNDGSGQQKTGMSEPPAPAIPSGGTLDFGVLAQDAEARVANGNGRSAACAGIAGNDGSVLQVGEGFCLTPGDDATLDLGLGSLDDLPAPEIPEGELDPILKQLSDALGAATGESEDHDADRGTVIPGPGAPDVSAPDQRQDSQQGREQGPQPDSQGRPGLDELKQNLEPDASTGRNENSGASTSSGGFQNASYQPSAAELPDVPGLSPQDVQRAIDDAVAEVDDQIGPLGLTGSFGAIQAICSAGPGLSGDANLANAAIRVQGGGQTLGLLSLPANPPPNTKLFTDLGEVVDLVLDDVRANLNAQLDPANQALDPVQAALDDVVAQVAPQLAPLEQNILEVTLNKQTRSNGTINVTALDARVLPAAQDQLGAPLASIQVADVACGGGASSSQPSSGPVAGVTQQNPQVPTAVSAGEPGTPDQGLPPGVVAGLLAMLGATALVGYRRLLGR